MKNIIKLLSTVFLVSFLFSSCKKQIAEIDYLGGTAPAVTASSTAPIVLLIANKDNPAISFTWTNPNYQFTTGISSQDVSFTLQFDTTGSNFTNPKKQEVVISKNLFTTLTVKDLNLVFTKMELGYGVPHNVEIRVKSSLANGSVPLYSNVIKIVITPYLDFAVEPPGTAAQLYLDGNLWIVGDAVASGWSNPLPSPFDASQKFARVTPTDILHYQATITFNASGGYKLIQIQGDWNTQYHAIDGTAKLSGNFEKKNSDPQFPTPGPGNYKVEVNFATGKYTLTKL